jgi:SAM-dependent methyltransferase
MLRRMAGDATGWFEDLYAGARAGRRDVPWAAGEPRHLLAGWARDRRRDGSGRRALVVGAGLGDDAELIARLGFATVAFDVAPTAIAMARERFPGSSVQYVVADLLDPPPAWSRAYDLVVESLTVQSLPPALHGAAAASVAGFVAPGGMLLALSVIGADGDAPDGPPWPLTRAEMDGFATGGVALERIERLTDPGGRPFEWWRAELRRPGLG